jgi:hypothetical protein
VLAWFIGPSYNVQRDMSSATGYAVVDNNPIERWALPSMLYAVGLAAAMVYAVAA